MKQVIFIKVEPSQEQYQALLETVEASNRGCQYAADAAYEKRLANKIALQPFVYGTLRSAFGLSSQMAIRAIAKAVEAYKCDMTPLALSLFSAGPISAQRPQAVMDTADHSGGWVGKTVQPFTLTSSDGKATDLSRVLGARPVALYRGVWCLFCQSQMADLSRHKAEFQQLGAAVYAVSNEDGAKLTQTREAEKLDFVTFLSDPDGAAAKKYVGLYPGSTTGSA